MKRTAALFLFVPFLLAGCAQSPGAGGGGATGFLADTGPAFSHLNASGLEKIKADKKAILDMRSGKLTREAAGLDSTAKSGSFSVPEGMDLTIIGPRGTVEETTQELQFFLEDGKPDVATLGFGLHADTDDAYFAMLNDGVKKYGIPGYQTDRWIQAISKTPTFSQVSDLGTGRSPGVQVNYRAVYKAEEKMKGVGVYVTPEPTYAPAAATPLGTMKTDKDPMSQYVASITTPEEKVAQLRAYTALPEVLNAASPVHEKPTSVYQDLFDQGIITAAYRDQNKQQTEWGTGQYPSRNAGYTYQVTSLYCPMHEQTSTMLDTGQLNCIFNGHYMLDGQPVSKSTAQTVTGWKTAADDEYQRAEVFMKKDGDTWKVDNIRFHPNDIKG